MTGAGEKGSRHERHAADAGQRDFLLTVITQPDFFPGEEGLISGLFEAGLMKLHLRKPGAGRSALEGLLKRLAPLWADRLVLHGSAELAAQYGLSQVHGSVELREGKGRSGGGPVLESEDWLSTESRGRRAVSTSVHSWEEFAALPDGLAYAFISPLFDSISKRGYGARSKLLEQPAGDLPCLPMGLGGIGGETIGEMIRRGWKGAAVLGWIWDHPQEAVRRFEQLKKIIDEQ
jgi:thiamine monophosphate synthase